MFVPMVLMCLIEDPNVCRAFTGPPVETKINCEVSIVSSGIPGLYQEGVNFVAESRCVEIEYKPPGEPT